MLNKRSIAIMASALALGPALMFTPAASAASGAGSPQIMSGCDTWIDGEWGKAQCYNSSVTTQTFKIVVTCVDIWDPDVTNYADIPGRSQGTLAGHCWGAVESVVAGPA